MGAAREHFLRFSFQQIAMTLKVIPIKVSISASYITGEIFFGFLWAPSRVGRHLFKSPQEMITGQFPKLGQKLKYPKFDILVYSTVFLPLDFANSLVFLCVCLYSSV